MTRNDAKKTHGEISKIKCEMSSDDDDDDDDDKAVPRTGGWRSQSKISVSPSPNLITAIT